MLECQGTPSRNRHEIWSLSECHWTRTHNHLVSKRTLNHLGTEWLWFRVQLQAVPKLISILLLNLLMIFIIDTSWLSFAAKILISSMRRWCEIISPWRLTLHQVLLVFRMKSNPDRISSWKMAVWLKNDQF